MLRKLATSFLAIAAGAMSFGQIMLPAFAGNYDNPHKWTDNATSITYVYVPGQTAGQSVSGFSSPKSPVLRLITLNNCGWGKFTKSSTSPPINVEGQGGLTVNWAGKSNGSAVTCTTSTTNGVTTYTPSNNATVGTVIDDGSSIWIRGGTSAGSASISVTLSGAITTIANACGFVRVTATASRPMTNFTIGTTNYTLSNLPSVTNPMFCRKVGTTSITYLPAI